MLFTKSVGLSGWFRLVGWPLGFRLLETLVRVALLLLRLLESPQESPRIPENPQMPSPCNGLDWLGLASRGGNAASEAPTRPRPHQPWEAMGRRLMDPSPQYREQLCGDEAACRACAHCVGGRHHRPRVGRDVQQVGRRHPWQGQVRVLPHHQIQVRTAEMIIRQRFSIKRQPSCFLSEKNQTRANSTAITSCPIKDERILL